MRPRRRSFVMFILSEEDILFFLQIGCFCGHLVYLANEAQKIIETIICMNRHIYHFGARAIQHNCRSDTRMLLRCLLMSTISKLLTSSMIPKARSSSH